MSAAAATDMIVPLTVTLEEIRTGPIGTEKLRLIRDQGWTEQPYTRAQIMVDAKSVYQSLRSTVFKPPSENSLAGHVLWMREMHDKGLLANILWVDTRDMYADGLTKGSIPRDGIVEAMQGKIKLLHDVDLFPRRIKRLTYLVQETRHDTEAAFVLQAETLLPFALLFAHVPHHGTHSSRCG
jgi:hypothetical protein